MVRARILGPILAASTVVVGLLILVGGAQGGGRRYPVMLPAKPVDLERYLGLWYEIGRYENSFERGCEGVTAHYAGRPDGAIEVVNTCHVGSLTGPVRDARGRAHIVPGSGGAKLKVTFFWPFFGDYWVLDHADDYSWSIVGEPSRRYLWLLSRLPDPPQVTWAFLMTRIAEFGYDPGRLRRTRH